MKRTDQYACQSYYDDDNVLRDCTCGKCASNATTNPTGSDLWPELPAASDFTDKPRGVRIGDAMPATEPQVDELREQIEPLLLSWNTIYGIELDTNQKHALLYEVISSILTLITTKRTEWTLKAQIAELERSKRQGYIAGHLMYKVDNRIKELKEGK